MNVEINEVAILPSIFKTSWSLPPSGVWSYLEGSFLIQLGRMVIAPIFLFVRKLDPFSSDLFSPGDGKPHHAAPCLGDLLFQVAPTIPSDETDGERE